MEDGHILFVVGFGWRRKEVSRAGRHSVLFTPILDALTSTHPWSSSDYNLWTTARASLLSWKVQYEPPRTWKATVNCWV